MDGAVTRPVKIVAKVVSLLVGVGGILLFGYGVVTEAVWIGIVGFIKGAAGCAAFAFLMES